MRTVEHFASRGAMDIEGMGTKIVEQLVQAGMVKDMADIYSLTKEELLKVEGFANKKAENFNNRHRRIPTAIPRAGDHCPWNPRCGGSDGE